MKLVVGGLWWGALLLLLLVAPLPLGAVNTWWSMPLALGAVILGAVGMLPASGMSGKTPWIPRAIWPLGLFLLVVLLQLLPVPAGLVRIVSPGRAAVPRVPSGGGWIPLSCYPGATLETLVLHGALLYLIWAVARRRPGIGMVVLGIVGALHAAFAFVLAHGGGTTSRSVLWVYRLPEVLTPFGSYVNKNHFAGLMLIGSGACTGGLLFGIRQIREGRESEDGPCGRGRFLTVLSALGLGLCVLAVFASGSRGAALALALAGGAGFLGAGVASRRMRAWPALLMVVLLAGAALTARATFSHSVLDRLFYGGRVLDRPRLWHDSLRMTGHFPLTGVGLGAFPYVFPRYQTFEPDRQFTHAEGDWMQYLTETGAAGVLCLAAFAILAGRGLFRALRAGGPRRDLAIGAGVGGLAAVFHGFVDSSLHIPSNLLAFSVLLGVVVALGASGREKELPRVDARTGGNA